eukprot:366485-Chlamydomonas_euryale.AAC.24
MVNTLCFIILNPKQTTFCRFCPGCVALPPGSRPAPSELLVVGDQQSGNCSKPSSEQVLGTRHTDKTDCDAKTLTCVNGRSFNSLSNASRAFSGTQGSCRAFTSSHRAFCAQQSPCPAASRTTIK